MHELSIVQEIVEIVAARTGGARVARVVLEIGKLSAVLPSAVRFCFDVATEGTALEGASLDIHETLGRGRCRACAADVVLDRPFGRCACGGTDFDWIAGDELRITQLEMA